MLTSLRADVQLIDVRGDLLIAHPNGCFQLGSPDPLLRAAVARLLDEPVDIADLDVDLTGLARLFAVVAERPALFCWTLPGLATAVAIAASATRPEPGGRDGARAVRLSRFAFLRLITEDTGDGISSGHLALESPLSAHRVVVEPPALAVLAALARGATAGQAAAAGGENGSALVDLLEDIGMLDLSDPDLWEFSDLLFHSRSRPGRADYLVGAHYRHRGRLDPQPARPPAPDGRAIDLTIPDWPVDPPFSEVLESRRSVRAYDENGPITVRQLGELLYRAARARDIRPIDPDGTPYEAVDRPYPSGGAAGELEFYLTVARCAGLAPGVYWYDSAAHQLRPIEVDESARSDLLRHAAGATAGNADPQVLLTITARFGRLSWKYSAIAYAATLKHVGVAYQTLYLVATAMGLAPCGLGTGDTTKSAAAFGLDWTTESAVGEFLIGSRTPVDQSPPSGFRDVVHLHRTKQ